MTATPPPSPEPAPPTPPGGPAPRVPWVTRHELRAGAVVIGVLVVVGVLAGFVWLWWSPSRGIALALGPHSLLPDETEAFIAADGRYALIAVVLGVLAGVGCWCWRSVRGPVLGVALAVGCVAGAALTAAVGRLFGGGVAGKAVAVGQQAPVVTPHLELRATGLIALQAAIALLVYGLSVTVSARDDLGVGDPGADDDDLDADLAVRPPVGAAPEAPPFA